MNRTKDWVKKNVTFFTQWSHTYDWAGFRWLMQQFYTPVLRILENVKKGKKRGIVLIVCVGGGAVKRTRL